MDVAGSDLKDAVLALMNKIRDDRTYPEALEVYDIKHWKYMISIYKMKGARNNFENYRGIFRLPILRTILDRLIYNYEYEVIDENLSDSNVGA